MGKRLNGAVLEAAKTAIDICIELIGIMALWLGLMNVAKDAGFDRRVRAADAADDAMAVSRGAGWASGARRHAA